MPVINGVYTKDFPALGRAPIDTDIIPIAEVANQITYKTTLGEIFNAKVFGTTGAIPKFTSANTLGDSIITELSDKIGVDIATPNNKLSINSTDPGSGLDLQIGATSYARFGIINPGLPGEPGVDNDCFIGSTINNDFLIRTNNTEALRIDTAQRLKIANIQNALGNTDKFLVSEDGIVKYRTGAEVLADIGAGTGSVTSVGLSMPVAFSVANTPITSAGTLDVTAIGTASQYIRGDGQLATLPTGAGGGSAVNYYLNGSIAASVAGYQQMSNSAIIGAGTDFNLVGNGLVAQFLTNVGNPNRLLIPGGAWNLEMFFSVSSAGGNQKFYVDLLKYNGTTFSLIATTSGNPEEITGGTSTDLYLTSIAVPETVLLATDRLAIRVYIVDNAVGRTVTLHTEDNNLCQIITTFAGGISALNGLTANTQYFAVGTSGTDFAISSVSDTHTFNLPTASGTKRGALSASDWNIFNNKQPAGNYVTLDTNQTIAGEKTFTAGNIFIDSRSYFAEDNGQSGQIGYTQMITLADSFSFINGATTKSALFAYGGGVRSYILPSSNGTIALTSDLSGYLPLTGGTLTGSLTLNSGLGSNPNFASTANGLEITSDGSTASNRNIILKIASSTALSIDNSTNVAIGYTTNPALYKLDVNGTGRFAGNLNVQTNLVNSTTYGSLIVQKTGESAINILGTDYSSIYFGDAANHLEGGIVYNHISNTLEFRRSGNVNTLTLSSTGAATFSSSVQTNRIKLVESTYGTNYTIYTGVDNTNSIGIYNETSGVYNLKIASTGAATFSSTGTTNSIFIGGASGGYGVVSLNGTNAEGQYIGIAGGGTSGTDKSLYYNSGNGGSHIFRTGNGSAYSEKMYITSGGNVLIGNPPSDNGAKLQVNGLATFSTGINVLGSGVDGRISYNGAYGVLIQGKTAAIADTSIFTPAGNEIWTNTTGTLNSVFYGNLKVNTLGTGTVYSNGGTLTNTNPSDANLKTEIQDLSYGLNEIMQLRPVSYLWKDDKINQGKQFGFIAQEVQKVMPDLVKEGDYLGLDKEAIFVTLINAIKELNEKITQLENK